MLLVVTEKSRSAPSAWLEEVRIFSGQCGQVSALFSFSGGVRHDFKLGHGQVHPAGSMYRCSLNRYRRRRSRRHACRLPEWVRHHPGLTPATRRFCWGRKSMAKCTPSSLTAWNGKITGFLEPPAQQHGVMCCFQRSVSHRRQHERRNEGDAFGIHLTAPASMRCFSILKSGMP